MDPDAIGLEANDSNTLSQHEASDLPSPQGPPSMRDSETSFSVCDQGWAGALAWRVEREWQRGVGNMSLPNEPKC